LSAESSVTVTSYVQCLRTEPPRRQSSKLIPSYIYALQFEKRGTRVPEDHES